ncbi:MAG: histidine--tRNA ligase [Acidobacteria bacterium]|nr:histidine--tRNA ligase [Acidobacteriota bacterium]
MATKYQTLRGFRDLLPGETERWQALEAAARELFRRYALREIRPPHLEATELFVRSVGETTDIVGKEMFTFSGDEGGSMSLRPEITASVCRAYVQHGLDRAGANRLWYLGPAFRKERPQKGRLRQFHQAGVEILGESAPETDVEVIAVGVGLVRAAGVREHRLLLNSIGDATCRPAYREALVSALRERAPNLCEECRGRIDRNPLRVLDCKNERCQAQLVGVPTTLEHLCPACREHFDRVRGGLESLGVAFELEPRLVRGLDYYVRTTFEIQAGGLGSQNAVLGGGRYDGLVAALGGGDVPGIGWAAGIERLLLAAGEAAEPARGALDAFVVTLGARARGQALPVVEGLRARGVSVGWDPAGHGLGGQMKRADRSGARVAVLIGDDELDRGAVTVKDLARGTQAEAPLDLDGLAAHLGRAAD